MLRKGVTECFEICRCFQNVFSVCSRTPLKPILQRKIARNKIRTAIGNAATNSRDETKVPLNIVYNFRLSPHIFTVRRRGRVFAHDQLGFLHGVLRVLRRNGGGVDRSLQAR